jgi:hypothetical protein
MECDGLIKNDDLGGVGGSCGCLLAGFFNLVLASTKVVLC